MYLLVLHGLQRTNKIDRIWSSFLHFDFPYSTSLFCLYLCQLFGIICINSIPFDIHCYFSFQMFLFLTVFPFFYPTLKLPSFTFTLLMLPRFIPSTLTVPTASHVSLQSFSRRWIPVTQPPSLEPSPVSPWMTRMIPSWQPIRMEEWGSTLVPSPETSPLPTLSYRYRIEF